MKQEATNRITEIIKNFQLPTYREIPEVGLYLDQTVKYINTAYDVLPNLEITSSMVSNYVKQGIIDRPVKKYYSRDQICHLLFIVIAKTVLPMDNIKLLFDEMQKVKAYPPEIAYEYFRLELDNVLSYVFGLKDEVELIGTTSTDTKKLLRNTIMSVSYKVYLDLAIQEIKNETPNE